MMLCRLLLHLALVVLSTATARAIGSFEVRAKADNPFEADREGWSVALLDCRCLTSRTGEQQ